MTHSAVGTAAAIAGHECVATAPGQIGFALFGPYQPFAAGRYLVNFDIRPAEDAAPVKDQTVLCTVDVCTDNGTRVLASKTVLAETLAAGDGPVSLLFDTPSEAILEFRVFVTGTAPLLIGCERRVTSVADSADRAPLFKVMDSDDPTFRDCFDLFVDYHNKGAVITPTDDGTIFDFLGIKLNVRNREDFQIIWEILVKNAYNFNIDGDVCAIDIGMNIGLASLYFARMPAVKVVYGFEPFVVPFDRALENFALNPALRQKIKAHNFGLGATTQRLSVLYDEDNTLSGSVRGRGAGAAAQILIRDASDVFRHIVHEVRPLGLQIVVKMDCEGSEFPIFESLDASGLLPEARIFLIEWHKWWSPEKTQHDLVSRLVASGFDVFDHTDLFDPFAGALYAVRRGGTGAASRG